LVKWAVVDVDSSTPHEKQKSEMGEERRALLGLSRNFNTERDPLSTDGIYVGNVIG